MSTLTGPGEPGGPLLLAWAELGSAVSRNEPGRRHVVRLSGPRSSLIVAGALSETTARRLAEAINELLDDSLAGLPDIRHGKAP